MLLHEAIEKANGLPIRRKCWGPDEKIYIKDKNFYGTAKNKSEIGYPVIIPVDYITATDWVLCSQSLLSDIKVGEKFKFLRGEDIFTRLQPANTLLQFQELPVKFIYVAYNNILYYSHTDLLVERVED